MARLKRRPRFKSKVDNFIIYLMNGKPYMRRKSSLTGTRVKTAKEFEPTMINARLMGKASKIGSQIYKALPARKKERQVYRLITGRAMKMLKEGVTEEEVKKRLS